MEDHIASTDVTVHISIKELLEKGLFDTIPLCTHIWNTDLQLISCNNHCVELFQVSSKEEFIQNFGMYSPEEQPNGMPSSEYAMILLKKGLKEGFVSFEWMHCLKDGTPIPCDITIQRFDYDRETVAVVYVRDKRSEIAHLTAIEDMRNSAINQFNVIWEKVDSAILIIDFETHRILDANPAAVNLYGGKIEDMIGSHCHDFFGVETCPITDLHQSVDRAERKFIRADGSIVDILKSVTVMEYKGKPALLESFANITEIKKANEKQQLVQAAERMRVILDSNPFVNILYDNFNKVVDCNQAAIEFWGFKNKDDFLKNFSSYISTVMPETQTDGTPSVPLDEQLRITIQEGKTSYEYELILNGQTRRVIAEKRRIPYGDGYGIVSYLFDITETYEHQRKLEQSKIDNELQLMKLNLAVKAAKIGLWDMEIVEEEHTKSSNEFHWSDELREILGFHDEKDFPNVLSSWSYRLHPDDHDRTLGLFEKHILDKTGQTPYDIEYRLLRKDDTFAYVRASGETVRDDDGNALQVVGALMDITETKKLIIEAEQQRLLAEEANKAKSAFLSTMSHEIRTPMNAILGIAEIQNQNEDLEKSIRVAFDKIRVSGEMLLGIINDILDLSKIEAGKLELIKSNYEVASLISDTSQLNMMRIGSKPITFDLKVDENVPVLLFGDELRIKQIINNLLSNAFKYTISGKVSLQVRVEDGYTALDKILVLKITDTGQGMTKSQVARLFDEYSRFNLEANRTTEGTGLGMSITKNLIQMMNGRISVDSELGVGTTFTVFIPQGKVNNDTLSAEILENLHLFRSTSIEQMKRTKIIREPMPYGKVLIVDDVESNIYVAKGLMNPYELYVESAESGYAAIDKIKAGKTYDVIFMDHMMPNMDGIETVKIIRAMGYKGTIVALTANAVTGQADIFLGNGFDDFISKPIDVRQLNTILNTYIRDKQPIEVIEEARREAENRKQNKDKQDDKVALNPQFIEIFLRDANRSHAILKEIYDKGDYSEESVRTYVIHTHGIKSALANIGRMDVSAMALKLESAARDGDLPLVKAHTESFLIALQKIIDELSIADNTSTGVTSECPKPNQEELNQLLGQVIIASEAYDEQKVDQLLDQLKSRFHSKEQRELCTRISEHTLHCEFDEIVDEIKAFVGL